MKPTLKRSQIWFKLSVMAGMLLGLSLFIESVTTYVYVSERLLREEAMREAHRKIAALERAGHLADIFDEKRLSAILDEVRSESPTQVVWIRVATFEGRTLAETRDAQVINLDSPGALKRRLDAHEVHGEIRESPKGKVLISVSPLHLGRPPNGPFGQLREPAPSGRLEPLRPPRLLIAEIGIYLNGVSVSFGLLRRDLAIECSAAAALVASMVLIALLFERYKRSKQLESELELAERVQRDLLPSPGSASESVSPSEFAAVSKPAAKVGGDFYDVFMDSERQVCLSIGDVSGKGLSAALLMGVIHGVIRSADWASASPRHEAASGSLNRLLCDKTAHERFASLFWSSFDPKRCLLRYVNAGHLPPVLVRHDANQKRATRLGEGGPVLGVLPGASYRSCEVTIASGDLLVAYSDGIVEATNQAEEEFGEERLLHVVLENSNRTPRQICDEILAEIAKFLGPLKAHDDQTLIVVRLLPVSSTSGQRAAETAIQVEPVAV